MNKSTFIFAAIGAAFVAYVTSFSATAPAIIVGGLIILAAFIVGAIEQWQSSKIPTSPFSDYKLDQLDKDLNDLKQSVQELHEQVTQTTTSVSNLQLASGFRNLKKE